MIALALVFLFGIISLVCHSIISKQICVLLSNTLVILYAFVQVKSILRYLIFTNRDIEDSNTQLVFS